MIVAAQALAVWLTPVMWLSMPTLILERGPNGLWIGLALVLAPLIALAAPRSSAPSARADASLPVFALLVTIGILFWANMVLAGDMAAWLGWPRWQGIVVTAAGGAVVIPWRGARRLLPALLAVSALAAGASLVELAHASGASPLSAWAQVATRTAFRFPAASPWVRSGRTLGSSGHQGSVRFEEEHRVTAPAGGRLVARSVEGGRAVDREWILAPGQSVTFRPGDQLQFTTPIDLQFEADKRVPGAPASGIAWAEGRLPDWSQSAGLLVTLLFGALAFAQAGAPALPPRGAAARVAAGVLAVFFWAQGWAVYSLLASPDLFLGRVSPERLLAVPALDEGSVGLALRSALAAGGLTSFVASSIALRERLGALDRTGGGEIGRDVGVWTVMFAIAGVAALWHLDAWTLALLALGIAASSVGPVVIGDAPPPSVVTAAGVVGLAVFLALAVAGRVHGDVGGWAGAAQAYPALAAAPAALLTRWIGSRLAAA